MTSELLGHVLMICVGCEGMHEVEIRSKMTEGNQEIYAHCSVNDKNFYLDEYYFE